MAGRANGLDLSEAIIIVDYIVIKNTSFMRIILSARYYGMNFSQDSDSTC